MALYFDQEKPTRFLDRLIEQIWKHEAERVELAYQDDRLSVTLFGAGEKEAHRTLQLPSEAWQSLSAAIRFREREWPSFGDYLWEREPESLSTWFHSEQSGLLSLRAEREQFPGGGESISLHCLREEASRFWDYLNVAENERASLEALSQSSSGLILNGFPDNHSNHISAAVLSALLPRALHVLQPESDEYTDILQLSQEQVVVLSIESNDPVELVFECASRCGEERALIKRFYEQLMGSLIYRRIPRSCPNCLRETPVSEEIRSSLPEALHDQCPSIYLFGRGCERCGHSTIVGTTAVSSTLVVSPEIRSALKAGEHIATVTELAYRSGTKSLLEDGLKKVEAGKTSFEALRSGIERVSPAFLAAISTRKDDSLNPYDQAISERLGSLEEDYFRSGEEGRRQSPQSGKTSLLIVEDDDDQREVLATIFELEGYEVRSAADGEEALTVLNTCEADLIVCDVMMPKMGGEELVRELRRSQKHQLVPVLMLTALESEESEFNLLAAGADDYCVKGTNKKVILKRVERLLHRARNPIHSS